MVSLINDKTGTLLASHYSDPQVNSRLRLSIRCSAKYMEEYRLIPKLKHLGHQDHAQVIINEIQHVR